MNGPRRVSGARALLFERLVDEDPERILDHPGPLVLLDFSGLKSSIGRELERLFSTRVAVSADRLERRGRTVIDYGIPDLTLFPPRDPEAETALAEHLTRAIRAYEPRLEEPRVAIERIPDKPASLLARITGRVTLDHESEPVSFHLPLNRHAG